MLRQAEQKQKQAINKYNSAVRSWNREADKHNRGVDRAINDHNREVRSYNSRVRADRQRLRSELARLANQGSRSRSQYASYSTSVETLHQAFVRVEAKVENGAWGVPGDVLLDLTESETANSVEVLNALLGDQVDRIAELPELRETSLTHELTDISPELNQRWRGALFALDPRNPDAARHFCASTREIFGTVLEVEAPDEEVLRSLPKCPTNQVGKPTRRAKIQFFLQRKGMLDEDVEGFVESDLNNVMSLFDVFNEGTHGAAGKFDLHQLSAIKRRVEDAIRFLYRVIR
jgi:hypothetical protein